MVDELAGGWSRREFLRWLAVVGAGGACGVYARPGTAVGELQASAQTDHASAVVTCPQSETKLAVSCPNCCNYSYRPM